MKQMKVHDFLKQIGQKGGRQTAKRGPEYYRQIQRKSVAARKRKRDERKERP